MIMHIKGYISNHYKINYSHGVTPNPFLNSPSIILQCTITIVLARFCLSIIGCSVNGIAVVSDALPSGGQRCDSISYSSHTEWYCIQHLTPQELIVLVWPRSLVVKCNRHSQIVPSGPLPPRSTDRGTAQESGPSITQPPPTNAVTTHPTPTQQPTHSATTQQPPSHHPVTAQPPPSHHPATAQPPPSHHHNYPHTNN